MTAEPAAMSLNAAWPKAYVDLGCRASFKAELEDFVVDEALGIAPTGAGEHLLLRVEKCATTTAEVARTLARAFGVAGVDVGYAGMKDKRAVARQWFSVRTPLAAGVACAAGCTVLEHGRHQAKLRRGQHAGNSFVVRLRNVRGADWPERLTQIATQGVPNYFGPQRFGRDNLAQALAWLPRRRRRRLSDFKQGLYLSVLRSYLFNEVLAARVRDDSWRDILPGDVTVVGSGETLVPSGPLWGRGRSASAAAALAVEGDALCHHAEVCDGLEHAGLRQQRRALRMDPEDLTWEASNDELVLRFALAPGGYATSLLGEVFDLESPASEDQA